jgi:hypothetical protein
VASRFVQLTDIEQVLNYLEADLLHYTHEGVVGKCIGGPEHGPYRTEEAYENLTHAMRNCTYGILVEEDAEQTDEAYV